MTMLAALKSSWGLAWVVVPFSVSTPSGAVPPTTLVKNTSFAYKVSARGVATSSLFTVVVRPEKFMLQLLVVSVTSAPNITGP